MKKRRSETGGDDMRPEYDFSAGVRGKYAERYRKGTNVVLLDPDLVNAFPDSDSVNQALHALLAIARRDAAARLIAHGATMPDFKPGRRRRSKKTV